MVGNVSIYTFCMGRKCFLQICNPLNLVRISACGQKSYKSAQIEQIRFIRSIVPQELVIKKHTPSG